MLCPKCGYYTEGEDAVCPECGAILNAYSGMPAGGAEAIRQGKRARQAIRDAAAKQDTEARRKRRSGASHATVEIPLIRDNQTEDDTPSFTVSEKEILGDGENEEPVFERRRRPVYDETDAIEEQARAYTEWIEKGGHQRLKMVNWMKITMAVTMAAILAIVGAWLFLKKTDEGQKLMARLGREANSSALWSVGEELMNTGDMEGAIVNFEKAKAQDEAEEHEDVDGLLMLASAYEAVGKTDEAAALYERIYTNTPSRTEAYVNHIRILRSSGRPGDKAKAGELMKTAYKMTGDSSFETQRRDFVPAPPEVDLTAGYYEAKKYIAITSYQGYDVYYTFDENAELPAGGKLWTERVFLDEGIWNLRAVAVNGELVSDELKGTYKIEAKPYPLTAWEKTETISGLELNKTTMTEFQSAYGTGTQVEMEQNPDFESELRKYEYPWGYAVMTMGKRNWVLVELCFNDSSTFKAPRGTGVGDPMEFVVGKFKDLGQVASASGNRGLYALDNGSDGKIWKQEEKTGKKIVRYRIKTEGHYYVLDYYINQNGTVTSVDWWYKP